MMILNRLAESDSCPSCKVHFENGCRPIERCSATRPLPLCHRFNHHLVIPLLLLPVILLLLGIVRIVARPEHESLLYKSSAQALSRGKHALEEFQDRDFANNLKTSFVPIIAKTFSLNVFPSKLRHRRELGEIEWSLHDVENLTSSDALVWDMVKPPINSNTRKKSSEKDEHKAINKEVISGNYNREDALQDDEQKRSEEKTTKILSEEKKNITKSFWNGRNDQETIRKAQAQIMQSLMNVSVDPCVDFYEYACGRWSDVHPIPKNKAGSGTLEILRKNINEVIRRILEDDVDDTIDNGGGNEKAENKENGLYNFIPAVKNLSHVEKEYVSHVKMLTDDQLLEVTTSSEDVLQPTASKLELVTESLIFRRRDTNYVLPDPILAHLEINTPLKSSGRREESTNVLSMPAGEEKPKSKYYDKIHPWNVKSRIVNKRYFAEKDVLNGGSYDKEGTHSRDARKQFSTTGSRFESEKLGTILSNLRHDVLSSENYKKRTLEKSAYSEIPGEYYPEQESGVDKDRSLNTSGDNEDDLKVHSVPLEDASQKGFESNFDEPNLAMNLKSMKGRCDLEKIDPNKKCINKGKDEVSTVSKQVKQQINDSTKKARDFYKSCMNMEIIEKRAEMPLIKLLRGLGGWPKEIPLGHSTFDMAVLAAKLRLYNNNILLEEWVGPDVHNSTEHVVQLDEAGLGLPTRDYFLSESNNESLNAYRHFITTVANLLGATVKEAENLAEEIVNFEIHLALITSSPEEKKNFGELYHRMTVSELCDTIPGINWRQYLGIVLSSTIPNFDMSSLNSTSVLVFALRYFQELSKLLKNYPPRIIQSYMLWRFASHRAGNLDERFLAARAQLRKTLTGREEEPPRWESCVEHTSASIDNAVGHLFVKQHFDEQSKRNTLDMSTEIQSAFRASILNPDGSTAKWMDKETRLLAAEKVDAMALLVGYPDSILDTNLLNLRYRNLKVDPELYFENTLAVLNHLTYREHSLLGTPVDRMEWSESPTEVNAFYSRNRNQMLLPAGILQPPFYHRHFPRSLNYGGVGVVIGHEITHGFDDSGRLFDQHGNLQKWWQQADIESFQERAKCLVDQYKQYYVEEASMQIDSLQTQTENIADNGGLKQAYKAYSDWLKKNMKENPERMEESLPGLKASPSQLFFLNFAQVWCVALRPEAIRNKMKVSMHTLEKFRVIGTLSNSEEFAEAFSCPLGSPMNPHFKCSVW